MITSALYVLTFAALVAAIQAWAFCFRGKTSAKNQLAQLHDRIAELESTLGGQVATDPTPPEDE